MLMIAVKPLGRMIGKNEFLPYFAQKRIVNCLEQRRFVNHVAGDQLSDSIEHERTMPNHPAEHERTGQNSTENHSIKHPSQYFFAIERAIEEQLRDKFGPKTSKVLKHDYWLLHQRTSVQEEPLDLKHKILPKKKEIKKSQLFFYGERECAVFLAGEFGFNLRILASVLGELGGKGRKIGRSEEQLTEEQLIEEQLTEEQLLEEQLTGEQLVEEQLVESQDSEHSPHSEHSLHSEHSPHSAKSSYSRYSNLTSRPIIAPFKSTLRPQWQPKTILDFGCGPASGLFAVRAVWPNCPPTSYTGIDISQEMLDAGNKLIESTPKTSNAQTITLRRFNSLDKSDVYDLVICSFSLLEISRDEQLLKQTLCQLWQQTSKYLVIVNKADREGWELTQKAKEFIGTLDSEAVVAAPCASLSLEHCSSDCACVFRARINTSNLTKNVLESKSSSLMRYFSYVVLERIKKEDGEEKRVSNAPRIVGIPKKMTKCVEFRLCCGNGPVVNAAVTPADGKQEYKAARKVSWGDVWPYQYRLQPKIEKQA